MEAVVALYTAENHRHQSLPVSPYGGKPVRSSPKYRAHHSFNLGSIPGSLESFANPANSVNGAGGLLNSQKQPPLLPLPVAKPGSQAAVSYPIPGSAKPIKPHRLSRHQSLNHNKPMIRRQGSMVVTTPGSYVQDAGRIVPVSGPRGPDPNELPKDMSLSKGMNGSALLSKPEPDLFSGSVFELAPPPSSLPLPRFSLRPKKIRCNAEAGANSGVATNGLRRILRLP